MKLSVTLIVLALLAVALWPTRGNAEPASPAILEPPPSRIFLPLVNRSNSAAVPPTATATSTAVPTRTPTPVPSSTPTIIPPTVTPTPTARPVFVFLQGYGTSSASEGFNVLKSRLRDRGYAASQLIDYSYTGGYYDLSAGRWSPYYYGCGNTRQELAESTNVLRRMMNDYQRAQATPVKFILIGHSLGGLIGWWHVYSSWANGSSLQSVSGLVTIDSPLRGLGSGRISLFNMFGPPCDSALTEYAQGNVMWLRDQWDTLRDRWRSVGQWATGRGMDIYTIGNSNDCVYKPDMGHCPYWYLFFSDDRESQYVDGLRVSLNAYEPRASGESGSDYLLRSHSLNFRRSPEVDSVASLAQNATSRTAPSLLAQNDGTALPGMVEPFGWVDPHSEVER